MELRQLQYQRLLPSHFYQVVHYMKQASPFLKYSSKSHNIALLSYNWKNYRKQYMVKKLRIKYVFSLK